MSTVGGVASVIGVIVAVVGFIVTILNVRRSKKAAQQAEQAALKVRQDMLQKTTVEQFASALTSMEEIKRLHREEAWPILPERYSALRKFLIAIRSANQNLPDHHKTALQRAIQYFAGVEKQVEEYLEASGEPPNVAKLNRMVSRNIDDLQVVLIEIKNQIGR
jgi:uncharacterized protein (DUF2267 family)